MFDTSLVRPGAVAVRSRGSLLVISLAIHSAVAVAFVTAGMISLDLPQRAPNQMQLYHPVSAPVVPPPLGRPDAPRTEVRSATKVTRSSAPAPQVAPTIAQAPSTTEEPQSQPSTTMVGEGEVGLPGQEGFGDPQGVEGGTGEIPSSGGIPAVSEGPLLPGGGVTAARVISRVEPRYPPAMVAARIRTATVRIRCVIDRHGAVHQPEVLTSSFQPFNAAVLDALRQWRFAPGMQNGRPVDTWFELTVTFRLN